MNVVHLVASTVAGSSIMSLLNTRFNNHFVCGNVLFVKIVLLLVVFTEITK